MNKVRTYKTPKILSHLLALLFTRKKTSLLTILFACSFAFQSKAAQETKVFRVDKMHCGACESTIEKAVCKGKVEGIESCQAKVVDDKQEYGTLTLTTKEGVPFTPEMQKKVTDLLKPTGYVFAGDYKPTTSAGAKK